MIQSPVYLSLCDFAIEIHGSAAGIGLSKQGEALEMLKVY